MFTKFEGTVGFSNESNARSYQNLFTAENKPNYEISLMKEE